jgi:hypothetical protein
MIVLDCGQAWSQLPHHQPRRHKKNHTTFYQRKDKNPYQRPWTAAMQGDAEKTVFYFPSRRTHTLIKPPRRRGNSAETPTCQHAQRAGAAGGS